MPVATFGLASKDIFEDFHDDPDISKLTGLTAEMIQPLSRARATVVDADAMDDYAADVVRLAEQAVLSREVFLIMSFSEDPALAGYVDEVTRLCEQAGFEAVRTDTRPQTETHQITDNIHQMIGSCGFVIADLTNDRPNVYYEVGYARGLGKKVILTAKAGTEVHFDLKGYNRYDWEGMVNLREKLKPVLEAICAELGVRKRQVPGR